jgi:wee1-like protein kinase
LADLGLSRESFINEGDDVRDGDSRYLAPEMIDVNNFLFKRKIEDAGINELYKADIFSLGASLLELMSNEELPKKDDKWQYLRRGINLHDFGVAAGNSYINICRKILLKTQNLNYTNDAPLLRKKAFSNANPPIRLLP